MWGSVPERRLGNSEFSEDREKAIKACVCIEGGRKARGVLDNGCEVRKFPRAESFLSSGSQRENYVRTRR